jgi:hypothetical protein
MTDFACVPARLPACRTDKGHGVVVTTHFQPEDYREFLSGSWPEFPFDEMAEFTVKHDD